MKPIINDKVVIFVDKLIVSCIYQIASSYYFYTYILLHCSFYCAFLPILVYLQDTPSALGMLSNLFTNCAENEQIIKTKPKTAGSIQQAGQHLWVGERLLN